MLLSVVQQAKVISSSSTPPTRKSRNGGAKSILNMSEVERKTSEQKFQWISSAMGKPLWNFSELVICRSGEKCRRNKNVDGGKMVYDRDRGTYYCRGLDVMSIRKLKL